MEEIKKDKLFAGELGTLAETLQAAKVMAEKMEARRDREVTIEAIKALNGSLDVFERGVHATGDQQRVVLAKIVELTAKL